MAFLDKSKNFSEDKVSTSSSADKLAAMRPTKTLPPRIITHSDLSSSNICPGRPITEGTHSSGGKNNGNSK